MMRARVAALWTLAIAAAGCGDPTLRVAVEVPAGFDGDEITIVVRAYASDAYACDQVEFSEVTMAELQAAFVDEATVGGADDTLSDVPREGAKLFVAEGLDATGRRVFAGCEGRGEITGDEVVTIVGHSIATTTISGDQLDQPFARRMIGVTAVDANGDPLDGRAVRWRSFGPTGAFETSGGVATSTNAICTARGIAQVTPEDPTTPGPIAAQIYVSWAEALPPALCGFIAEPNAPTVALDDGFTSARTPSCVVRTEANEDVVYCLTRPNISGSRGIVRLTLVGNMLGLFRLTQMTKGNALVVAPDANGDGDEDLYAVAVVEGTNDVTWSGLAGTPDGGTVTVCTGSGCLVEVTRIVATPACGGTPGLAVIAADIGANDRFIVTSLAGEPTGAFVDEPALNAVTLVAGGCVTDSTSDGASHPAFATRLGAALLNVNQVRVLCPDTVLCKAQWVGAGAVGFSDGARPRLLSSEIDLSGNVIVESEIAIAQGQLFLVERGRTPTVGAAQSLASGDLDADGHVDLVWTMAFDAPLPTQFSNRIQIALDTTDRDLPFPGRLTGLSPERRSDARAQVLVADLDHDGHDDVLAFSDVDATLYRAGVSVEPMTPIGTETLCR